MKTSVYAKKSLKLGLKTNKKNYIITGSINKLVKKLIKRIPES